MKCFKCKQEVSEDFNFCNNCGTKIELNEKSPSESLDKIIKDSAFIWFLLGLVKGMYLEDKKKREWYKKVVEKITMKNPRFKEQYEFISSEFINMFPKKFEAGARHIIDL